MASYRPRRTRIYGANYDIGERYYRKQLDDLDNKRGHSRFHDSPFTSDYVSRAERITPKITFAEDTEDGDFYKPRKYSRNRNYPDDLDENSPTMNMDILTSKLDSLDTLNVENYGLSLKRDNKKFSYNTPIRDKDAFSYMDDEAHDVFKTRRLKISSETSWVDDKVLGEEVTSRAKATKARLADLEAEMETITEKQNEREKLKTNLKKLLSESETDNALSLKKITF